MNPAAFQQHGGGAGAPPGLYPNHRPQNAGPSPQLFQAVATAAGMNVQQLQMLPVEQRQMLFQKYMQMQQQHQQQQHQHQQQQSMMGMHPPQRPPTAQGQMAQHISRPGTSLSHRSPTIPTPGLMIDRPQSRMADGMFKQNAQQAQFGGGSNTNPNASPTQLQMHNPSPSSSSAVGAQGNNPYQPSTSPTRGAKRKVTGDIVPGGMGMGMGMGVGGMGGMNMNNMNMMGMGMSNNNPMASGGGVGGGMPGSPRIGAVMGPPGLPRSISSEGLGVGVGGPMSANPMANNPMSSNPMANGMVSNMNNAMGMGMNPMMMNGASSPRPQSSMGMGMGMGMGVGGVGGVGGMSGMGNPMNANMNPMMNMGVGGMMGMGGGLGGGDAQHQQQLQQLQQLQQQQQRAAGAAAGGLPGANAQGPQTPMRQGSLPPQTPLGMMGGTPSGSMGPGGAGGMQMQMPGTPLQQQASLGGMRQGSLPPGSGGMPGAGGQGQGLQQANAGQQQPGMPGAGMPRRQSQSIPPGAAGHPMMGVGVGGPASPLFNPSGGAVGGGMGGGMNAGLGGGGGSVGPMALAPSMSASSVNSLGGAQAPVTPLMGASSLGGLSAPSVPGVVPPTGGPSAPSVPMGAGNGLPPLPANVSLNPAVTIVTPVPLLTSLTAIPALDDKEIEDIKEWMEIDKKHGQLVTKQKVRARDELRSLMGWQEVWPAVTLSTSSTSTSTSTAAAAEGAPASGSEDVKPPQESLTPAPTARNARSAITMLGPWAPKWWEQGALGSGTGNWNRYRRPEKFRLIYERPAFPPGQGARMLAGGGGHARKGKVVREGIKLPQKVNPEDANRPELLVPIRIEFDVEHHKMRDTFVWNLNDAVISPEAFAQSIVEDYQLAPSYLQIITKHIHDQLSDFKAHHVKFDTETLNELSDEEEPGMMRGVLDEVGERWWGSWRGRVRGSASVIGKKKREKRDKGRSGRKKRKIAVPGGGEDEEDVSMLADTEQEQEDESGADDERGDVGDDEEDEEDEMFRAVKVDEIKVNEASMHEEMRILVKLDIIVASVKLEDQFEWDLDNPHASPEDFAEVYTQELGLNGEFKTAIAHSIREQVQTYQKSLFLVGHPSDGSAVQDDDIKQSFLPSLTSVVRPSSDVQSFMPVLNYLSEGELERTEKERDKDLNKRRKRNTRGRRGIALPDREPIRTYRTPAIGFPELDAATLALQAAANAPMSRRAAAAAASLTIANMVATENGETFRPQSVLPTQPPPPSPNAAALAAQKEKEKEKKGHFKAPSFPNSVLKPRASVVAPTPSTAMDGGVGSSSASASAGASMFGSQRADGGSASAGGFGGGSGNLDDDKANKLLSAKRAKELEREAKEKEFVDGQHPNYIDGVWHCSNCGCPESVAVGRRKGPLGDKSQCGTCGKFWHRHRRPRPVEYNPDLNYHKSVKNRENEARTPASKKKGAAAALRAQNAAAAAASATPSASRPSTPAKNGHADLDSKERDRDRMVLFKDEDDRAMSPISSASSASEAPLAQKVKLNGNHSTTTFAPTVVKKEAPTSNATPAHPSPSAASPVPATKAVRPPPTPSVNAVSSSGETPATPATAAPAAATSPVKAYPPPWLTAQMQLMQAKYPNDRFEVIFRKNPQTGGGDWRIKCVDCPGKLYTPGPQETLSNYEVHLKNRLHRQKVNERIAAVSAPAQTNGAALSS